MIHHTCLLACSTDTHIEQRGAGRGDPSLTDRQSGLIFSGLNCLLMSYKIRSGFRGCIYRIAGNFRGVLIFVIFVTIPRVTKFSTHEFFHPRIFSRLLTSFAYRASGVTKFKTTKINSEDLRQLFTKICTPENYQLYGSQGWVNATVDSKKMFTKSF